MAKKKINIKSVTSDVPSGDVNISYKNVRIAGLSESATAVLETEDTICEDDIEVEYTKPTAGISLPEISGSYPDDLIFQTGTVGKILYEVNDKIVTNETGYTKVYLVPQYDSRDDLYSGDIVIYSETDNLNVTINNTTVPFNTGGYSYRYSSAIYPEGFTVVVTNK